MSANPRPSSNPVILFNNRLTPEAFETLKEGAARQGYRIEASPSGGTSVLGYTEDSLEGYEIAFGQFSPEKVLASTTLRWLHISSAGYTRFDTPEFFEEARRKGLLVTNSSSVYAEPCAETLMAYLLAGSRLLPQSLGKECPNGSPEWDRLRSGCVPLRNQKVLLLGFGAIARRLLEMLAPFQMECIAFRRLPRGDEKIPVVSLENLPAALAEADHVMNILPDNRATRLFFNAERFRMMKPGARFYNMGRGTTVDQEALYEALHSGHLDSAWLDVTDPEPLPADHPLRRLPNCYITPHIGGGHRGETRTLVSHFLKNLQRYTRGEALLDRIL